MSMNYSPDAVVLVEGPVYQQYDLPSQYPPPAPVPTLPFWTNSFSNGIGPILSPHSHSHPHPPFYSAAITPFPDNQIHTTTYQSEETTTTTPPPAPPAWSLFPLPKRILKNDIRRQYGRMFANVMNSGDHSLISSFFDRYTSSKSFTLQKRHELQQVQIPYYPHACIPNGFELHGKEVISSYWMGIMSLTPDHTVKIDDVKIKTKQGESGSRLECTFQVDGTKMYRHIHPDHIANDAVQQFQHYSKSIHSTTAASACSETVSKKRRTVDDAVSISEDAPLEFPCKVYDPLQSLRDSSGILPPPTPSRINVTAIPNIFHESSKLHKLICICTPILSASWFKRYGPEIPATLFGRNSSEGVIVDLLSQ